MKRLFLCIMCLATMMTLGTSLTAQEVTITLNPGWNWISYPRVVAMGLDDALDEFTPMEGDILKSQFGYSVYEGGSWSGGVTHFLPGKGFMYYSARTEVTSFVFAEASASSVVVTATPIDVTAMSAVLGGMVTPPEGGHVFLCGVCWGTESNPDIDGNHTSKDTATGSFSDTIVNLNPNTTYYVRAYAVTDYGLSYGNELNFTTLDGGSNTHEYVDLGLPSGTLWATCNVGAASPEDYGDYFAWGETQPKTTYSWSTYQYCNGSENTITKYCNNSEYGYNGFIDNLTVLLSEDDVATVNWGADWRMPTKEEWEELYNNTTCTWTSQNGVNGRLFTASNGNSLFLPAAGCRDGNEIYSEANNGFYWSSSLRMVWSGGAWGFFFASGDPSLDGHTRYSGFTVRPIHSLSQNNAPSGAINGKFTINANDDQVYFSQGNLQYIGSASTPYWKFAENQWDCLGTTTGQNSSEENVDRDLFGWGTSGWDCGNAYYRPWDTYNSTGSSYGPAGSNNLTGSYANADWGVYNPISNGGNQANQWRTLTNEEWMYVFNTRSTESGIRYAKANVNDVNGVILLPDDWNASYYNLSDTNTNDASYNNNTITASEWSVLEQHGAVFLPATGYRFGTSVKNVGGHGYYWSSSFVNSTYAYGVYFYNSDVNSRDCSNRTYGRGIRLVCVAE